LHLKLIYQKYIKSLSVASYQSKTSLVQHPHLKTRLPILFARMIDIPHAISKNKNKVEQIGRMSDSC
jgi:hypothetical protein